MGFRDDDEMLQMRAEALEREIAAVREAIDDLRGRVGENVEVVRKRVHAEEHDGIRTAIAAATRELTNVEASWPLHRAVNSDGEPMAPSMTATDGCAAASMFYLLVGFEILLALRACTQ